MFRELHKLFDKHAAQLSDIIDEVAERIQLLGGVSYAMGHEIARLLQGHEIVLREARTIARLAADHGDDGTNDLLVSGVIRTNELQVWFLNQHLQPEYQRR
jgi:starvation-inducible DNA-binding protein